MASSSTGLCFIAYGCTQGSEPSEPTELERCSAKAENECRGKEKQKAAGWLKPTGEWAEHSAVQRQESHVPHYRATKSIFYPITRTSFWVRMPNQ
ncbi:hypothetical protein M405DRAFT_833845, partial [Rhizopogon salebrosus TDB-379]